MGLDEAVTGALHDVVAGVGFRGKAGADDIVQLVLAALDAAGVDRTRLCRLATAEDRVEAPALRTAATDLRVLAVGFDAAALRAVDAQVPTRSSRLEASRGVGSLAEAAALAGAGPEAELIVSRMANAAGSVTCALALANGSA